MHELVEWRDFYVMIGTAAGAIVGAAFIVATLTAGRSERSLGMRGFITPTTVHLGSVLIGSAILTVPTLTPLSLSILLGVCGILGVAYSLRAASRIWHMRLDLDDRCFYVLLPILAYAASAVAAVLTFSRVMWALEMLAAAQVTMLIIGIRNIWDMAAFMISRNSSSGE
jgi:hypothetical protein